MSPVSGALCVLPEWICSTTSFSIAIPKEASKGSRNEDIETTKGLDKGKTRNPKSKRKGRRSEEENPRRNMGGH